MRHHQNLNRRAEIRHDDEFIESLFRHDSTRIILSHQGKYICDDNNVKYFDYQQLLAMDKQIDSCISDHQQLMQRIYLGEFEELHYFVIPIPTLYPQLEQLQLVDLRTIALSADLFDISSLFYSHGLINWHFNHQFCAKCGTQCIPAQSGHSRVCTNKKCNKEHFPRIEPAVIFSVETEINGIKKLLLARQANWPKNRYSVLAGFAEHGESLEHSVAREAMEEVGLKVFKIKYHSSQPWPFPASLMLGFTCETNEHDIHLVDQELEHAKWFSAEEMKSAILDGELVMPFSVSISWQLVELWYYLQTGQSIKSICLK